MRPSKRDADQLREITIERQYTRYAEGSVLICFGETKVICNASIIKGVPRFLKGKGQAWLTVEYGMLPRSTHERMDREATRGKQSGRTMEIQRLIGRALRSAVDLQALPEYTIHVDCDVMQADGGTRTAAITGASVAVADALAHFKVQNLLKSADKVSYPLKHLVASVSVGIYKGVPVLDLDYAEDANAGTDMNVVMNEAGHFIEIQGTAEGEPFSDAQLKDMLCLARAGITQLIAKQKTALQIESLQDLKW